MHCVHLLKFLIMDKITIKRVDDAFAFEATDSNGNTARMDAAAAIGGHDSGIRPMQVLLMGIGGCGGIDIVAILKKQRQEISSFHMEIEGEREQGKDLALWKYVKVHFFISGPGLEQERAEKACALSLDKYCSVAATLRAAGCSIEWDVTVN